MRKQNKIIGGWQVSLTETVAGADPTSYLVIKLECGGCKLKVESMWDYFIILPDGRRLGPYVERQVDVALRLYGAPSLDQIYAGTYVDGYDCEPEMYGHV